MCVSRGPMDFDLFVLQRGECAPVLHRIHNTSAHADVRAHVRRGVVEGAMCVFFVQHECPCLFVLGVNDDTCCVSFVASFAQVRPRGSRREWRRKPARRPSDARRSRKIFFTERQRGKQ